MAPTTLQEQLVKYLTDAHSIEHQALAQMRAAPDIAGDDQLAAYFTAHLAETAQQEALVRGRLEAHGASPAVVKDLVGRISGQAFVLFARSQPDTPGKLVVHGYSYEHMELAAYQFLTMVAERAGDPQTAAVAHQIEQQERAMAERLEASFDRALEASLRDHPRSEVDKLLPKYLADAHALESQSEQLLGRGPAVAGSAELAAALEEHLGETRQHLHLVEERLSALGGSPSQLKDAVLRLGGLNWSGFFAAQPDTPAKLAAFAYAVEHLEAGAYELLRRVAARAGDGETEAVAGEILAQERAAAQRINAAFPSALEAALGAQGLDRFRADGRLTPTSTTEVL